MKTSQDEIQRIIELHDPANRCVDCMRECKEAISAEQWAPVDPTPGRMTALDALNTFSLRRTTTLAAGIQTCGFDETLEALQGLPGAAEVFLFAFKSSDRYFLLFVDGSADALIGCIRVSQRPSLGG